MIKLLPVTQNLISSIAPLVANFRVALKSYKGITATPNLCAAAEELQEYLSSGFPCYAALINGAYAGYLVCRIEEPCVWIESIYVLDAYRRHGVATALLHQAEALASAHGENTVFNYVHPNNDGMIAFLRKHGYTVLNLIEIRKPYPGETLTQMIQVGAHSFDY